MLEQGNDNFEKDCLAVFEKLLQGYKRAKESNVWEANIDELIDKITQIPTEPFSKRLMGIFDYDYLVKSESIESIIEKSLLIREQMEHTQRFVTVNEKYFSLPFVPAKTHRKKLEVYNNKGELCYTEVGKVHINIKQLILWIFFKNSDFKLQDIFNIEQSTKEFKTLEIYFYSEHINLSTTDHKAYYTFFCDYYGKHKFLKYINTNQDASEDKPKATGIKAITELSKVRQVLWANFIFNLIGLRLRENLDTSSLTKFLLLLNKNNLDDYKNSYFYKLAGKLHELDSRKYLRDLEYMRNLFLDKNLSTRDIDREIKKMKRK